MHMVGSVALDAARVPGAAVLTLAGDVATAVGAGLRTLAKTVVRDVAAVLQTRGPALVALLGAARPGRRLATSTAQVHTFDIPRQPTAPGAVRRGRATTRRYELALPADATAPRRARGLLHEAAQRWDVDEELYHDAAMVVTELVANAVDHARTASTLLVSMDARGLSVAVRDRCPGRAPRPQPVDPTAPRGRGLQMVEALATSWGVIDHPDGKTVWAVLGHR